jgi:uncharacterized membrane protein YfcA
MNPLVIPIIFFAYLIQAFLGFGSGLIAMPMLIAVLSPDLARPAFALLSIVSGPVFLYKYRHDWQWSDVWRLLLATLIGIPLGMFLAKNVDEHTFMLVLGFLLIIYALYGLFGFKLPELSQPWGYLFGLISGFLHSAYNVGGPPLVMYCASHDWTPRRFKGNMQVLFFFMGFFIIASHFLQGNITLPVLQNLGLMIPSMLSALALGFYLDKFVKPTVFRKAVLLFLIVLGVSLML